MSSIIKGLVDEQGVEETKKLSAQEKFKRSMARAGYDMDAGAKRLQDLLARQKKEREEFEKKEKEIKEGPAVDAYMAGKSPAIAHFADKLDKIKEDETLQYAAEVTPKVSPYAGIKDRKFRGAIGEGIRKMFETPNESPTDSGYQQGGWRKMNEQEVTEDLRKWFKEKWVRFGPDGKIRGACARGSSSEGKPKCLPQAKAHALGKKGRKYAAAKKRREDPNPERSGPAKNVATKKKSNEGIQENMQANYKNYSTQDLLRMIKTIKRDEIGMKIIKAISNELIRRKEGVAEDSKQNLSIQNLATISDEALDKAYGYGRSTPGNTFGWQANLMSAAYAKKMIDAGVTDIEKISDAIHKGWNVTAQKFVQNPDQFDDTEKLRQAGKLEAKLQQRAKLMKINYAQLDNEEQEKDRVVARALLQAIKGQRGVAENASGLGGTIGSIFDPVLANLQRAALLAMQGRHSEAENSLRSAVKNPAAMKEIAGALRNIKPVTINGQTADSSALDKSKPHQEWILKTFVPWAKSVLEKNNQQGVAEGYTGRETKDGTWRVFKDGQAVAVAGPFKSRDEAHAWIKKHKQGVAEGFSDISGLLSASNLNKSYIVTAELAEGGKKKFRVKAQNERVAIEKFKKHHSMAKIINVEEEGVNEGSKYPRNPASYHLKKYPVPQDQMARPVKKEPKKPEKKPENNISEGWKTGASIGAGIGAYATGLNPIGIAAFAGIGGLLGHLFRGQDPKKVNGFEEHFKDATEFVLDSLPKTSYGELLVSAKPKLMAFDNHEYDNLIENVLIPKYFIKKYGKERGSYIVDKNERLINALYLSIQGILRWLVFKDIKDEISKERKISELKRILGNDSKYMEYFGISQSNQWDKLSEKTDKLDELKCWPGYSRVQGVPAGAPGSCKKKTNEEHQQCPECGGAMYEVSLMNEKKDACYYKVKSRYKVWPSAYASGALVKCRKKGANNWGNKSKSNEGQIYSTGGGAGEAQRYYTPKDNLGEAKSNILSGILKVNN